MKISLTKKIGLITATTFALSWVGLGLAIDANVNKGISGSVTLSALEQRFLEKEKRYENINFLKDNAAMEELLDTKGRFLLYVGTQACVWCRVTYDLDERIAASRASEFEDPNVPNALFRNLSAAFDGTANGPINDKVINDTYPMYALHDLEAATVSEYHSGTSKKISDILLSKLENRNDIKALNPVPFKNNTETVISSDVLGSISTKASSYKAYYSAFNDATEFKMRSGASLSSTKDALLNRGTYGTPSWWLIINGQPRYFITNYLTRAALEGVASWFLGANNSKTITQLDRELIS